MRLSLDTHILLWWLDNPSLLSKEARAFIQDSNNIVYISAAVTWEIMIKKSLDKIQIPGDLAQAIKTNEFADLPITVAHTLALEKLPAHHGDPFDRMIIAQAQHEGLTVITRDPDIHKYPVAKIVG